MKKFEVKAVKEIQLQAPFFAFEKASYLDLFKLCLYNVPKGGFDYAEMKKRSTLEGKLTELSSDKELEDSLEIDLEDADAKDLKKCVQEFRWGAMNKELLGFLDAVNEL